MSELHITQARILRELLFKNGTNFASLNTNKNDVTSDLFTFHIKKLITDRLIEKKENKYYLTQKGKMFAGSLDIDSLKLEKQGTPGVTVTARKTINGKQHFLIQKRLKEPFLGLYSFVNGKVRFGEHSVDTARREFEEETGLTGTPRFLGISRKISGPNLETIKIDKYFLQFIIDEPEGELKDTEEGANAWKTIEEIRKLNLIPSLENYVDFFEKDQPFSYFEQFVEVKDI